MAVPKRQFSFRTFALPALMIVVLLAVHWIVSDWPAIPRLISSTLAAIR